MENKLKFRFVALAIFLSLLILAFDTQLPLGVAGGVPYVALVLLGIWLPRRRHVYVLAAVGTGLAILGYFLSPSGSVHWVVLSNRGLALFAIWMTALVVAYLKFKSEALRQSESDLNVAQHTGQIGSWTWKVGTGKLRWSDEHYRIFGVEPVGREINFDDFLALVHLDDRAATEAVLTGPIKIGSSNEIEYRIVRPDGETRYIRTRTTTTGDASGSPATRQGTAQDITERHLAEQRFKDAMESISDAVIIVDKTSQIVLANAATEKMFGYARGDILGQPIERLVPDHLRVDHVALRDEFIRKPSQRQVYRDGGPLKAQRSDGSTFPVEIGLAPIAGSGGGSVVASIRDISDRTAAEEKLRDATSRLEEAQSIAHIGNWEFDGKTGGLTWSDEVYRIFGVRKEDFEPTEDKFMEFVHPDDRENLRMLKERELTAAREHTNEYRIIRSNHEVRTIREAAITDRNDITGDFRHAGTVQDITDQVRAEEWLRHSERTEALASLASGVAHEINNMLTPITILTSHTMNSLPSDGQEHRNLAVVQSSAERAGRIVKGLLTFSRQDGGSERLPTDINLLLAESIALVNTTKPLNIVLHQNIGTISHPVRLNSTQFHQIMVNLAKNAFDAIGDHPGEVTIGLDEVELTESPATVDTELRPGGYARIRVSDTGCGMSEDVLTSIFRPFFTTKEVGSGTGLGMPVVHGIVLDHDGGITVTSEPGAGTVFSIYLPLIEDSA